MMKKILCSLLGLSFVNFVSAGTLDWTNMGPGMMYGSGAGYGMMGAGTGMLGGLLYILIVVNLVFLAIFLYKKIWGNK